MASTRAHSNDGDGRVNEDDLGGPDPNRNFPFGWSLDADWPYPMSENETRNVFEFQLKHPNIFASFHYHNTGRLIMFMAPPDTRTDLTPEQRQADDARVAAQLAEARKTDRYAQRFSRVVAPDLQNDMDSQVAIVTEGARTSSRTTRPPSAACRGRRRQLRTACSVRCPT